MVRKTAFLPPPRSILREPRVPAGIAHTVITKELVWKAFMVQSTQKALGPDKIKFGILRLIWSWEAEHMTQMVQQAVRLGYHPREWKRAHGILLEKGGKRDLTLVKSYRVISLLNCMGKILEKLVAEQ